MKSEKLLCILKPLRQYSNLSPGCSLSQCAKYSTSSSADPESNANLASDDKYTLEPEKFRILQLTRAKFERKTRRNTNDQFFKQPREGRQSVTQEWGNVWPGPRMFHPASVPLPVRMGYPRKQKPSPDKWANAELMKIPNFFHLTPPVIKTQCEAIKKFCTEWPEGLNTEEEQVDNFPVSVTTSQYLHASPTIRDPRSRVVILKVPLDYLDLSSRGKDKMLRLVGPRYNPETNVVTLTADRCPVSKQNYDYCVYLLTVLYNESVKNEPWEHERRIEDLPYMEWEDSSSAEKVRVLDEKHGIKCDDQVVQDYKEAVLKLHNEGEDDETIEKYGKAVLKLVHFQQ